jgi:hypothetical protein
MPTHEELPALNGADEELLLDSVSDEALEAAAGFDRGMVTVINLSCNPTCRDHTWGCCKLRP